MGILKGYFTNDQGLQWKTIGTKLGLTHDEAIRDEVRRDEQERRAAIRTLLGSAHDVEDARLLLDALGLDVRLM